MPVPRIDLSGKVFGRWTVVEFSHKRGKLAVWLCHCFCGAKRMVYGGHLIRGNSTSCGCARAENSAVRTHGQAGKTAEYQAWLNMKNRCNNPKVRGYSDYGGRGISVCRRWTLSFRYFYLDMGKKPTPQHTLERIDNNGNYRPSNCRWATRLEQRHNQRRCHESM